MARTITMSIHNPEPWDAMGLDAALNDAVDGAETRNERPSEHGDSSGEMFAVAESRTLADGKTYHIIFTTTWCNDWSPWTSGSTLADLYDSSNPADVAAFRADVAEWEARPELAPDFQDDEDIDPESSPVPPGWDAVEPHEDKIPD